MQALPLMAVRMPSHARVNNQCYPTWNADRSDLQLIWRGTEYTHDLHAFPSQIGRSGAPLISKFVQRLWCTDSGAAGHYGGNNGCAGVPLVAAWLGHPETTYHRVLNATEGSATMTWTNHHGPGTLVVAGSTLYFYTFTWTGSANAQGLPRLSSLVFAEWRADASGPDLVSDGIKALNVLGYSGNYYWHSLASPLYPSGAGAVTLSVEDYYGGDAWAIDAVVQNGARGALVHYLRADCPSVVSASREVATFPGYSCRAFMSGSVQCAAVGAGKYTWASAAQTALGWSFSPLRPFVLPGSLWLHAGVDTGDESSIAYTALAGFGHAPALGVAGDSLVAIEARNDAGCPSRSRLHRVTRALPSGAETAAEPLGCEWRVVAPQADIFEPAYGALAVKWAGPWAEGPLLTAVDMEAGVYHLRGTPETETGDPSREHVAWGRDDSVIVLHVGGQTLRCPVLGRSGVPTDVDVVMGSAQKYHGECLSALVPARVAPDAVHDGCPLLAHPYMVNAINMLLAEGADLNAKCANGSTPLRQALENDGAANTLLRAGAAVCTWPLSAVMPAVRSTPSRRRASRRVAAAARKMPCEPGFWLAPGVNCSGLTLCAPGSYCPGYTGDTNAAAPCPAGTFGPLSGAVSVAQCRPCPPERPYSAPGSTDACECIESATQPPRRAATRRRAQMAARLRAGVSRLWPF